MVVRFGMQKISVAWNNCFRRIFSCCWRERWTTTVFCHTLPISYLLHQRKLLFWKKLYCSDSVVLQSLSRFMHQTFVALGILYNALSPKLSNNLVRTDLELICHVCGLTICVVILFLCFLCFKYCVFYCCMSGCHLGRHLEFQSYSSQLERLSTQKLLQ